MKGMKCRILGGLLAAGLLLGGCATTVEELYCLPRRSEDYNNLQSVMDKAMNGMSFCAPLSGDNQQSVQMADLTGDGVEEVIAFAKGSGEKPLKVLVFTQEEDSYRVMTTLETGGTGFDQVDYAQMDGVPGLELVVGCQISDQVPRNVTVYRFAQGQPEQLMNMNYRKYMISDLNADTQRDLLLLRPGALETDNGVAELYTFAGGAVERSAEVELSAPVNQLKRMLLGSLYGGQRAVFAASAVHEGALITDVFAMVDGMLTNVAVSSDSGTSVGTLRNYYVYSEDIDRDSEMELPSLITMHVKESRESSGGEYMIRWYSLASDGTQVDKLYTYHNYLEGWYLTLDENSAARLCVQSEGSGCYSFSLWDPSFETMEELWRIYVLTGDDRSAVAAGEGRFVLLKTDTVVYACQIQDVGLRLGIAQEQLAGAFHLVRKEWRTGEM